MSFQLENLSHQDWNQHFRNSSRPAISLARTKVDMCSVSPTRSLAQTAFNVSSLTKVTVAGLALSSSLHHDVTATPGRQSGLRVTFSGKSGSFVTVSGKRYSQVTFTRSVTVLKSQDGWQLPLIVVRKLDLCLDRRLRQQTNVYVSHIFGLQPSLFLPNQPRRYLESSTSSSKERRFVFTA